MLLKDPEVLLKDPGGGGLRTGPLRGTQQLPGPRAPRPGGGSAIGLLLRPRGPLKGPRGPFKGPRGPLKGPRGRLKGPQGPLKGPRDPLKGPQGPLKRAPGSFKRTPGVLEKDPGICTEEASRAAADHDDALRRPGQKFLSGKPTRKWVSRVFKSGR